METSMCCTCHCFWLDFCNQLRHDLALVLTDVHKIFLCTGKLIDCGQHSRWGATNVLYVGLVVNVVQDLNLAAIIEEHFFLLGVGFVLLKVRHLDGRTVNKMGENNYSNSKTLVGTGKRVLPTSKLNCALPVTQLSEVTRLAPLLLMGSTDLHWYRLQCSTTRTWISPWLHFRGYQDVEHVRIILSSSCFPMVSVLLGRSCEIWCELPLIAPHLQT